MSEYVSLIVEKKELAKNLLDRLLKEDKISISEYSEFLEINEQLSKALTALLTMGNVLLDNNIIRDLNDLFISYTKPKREEQCFLEMKELIEGELGSKNAYIQRIAASIAKSASQVSNLPLDIPISAIYCDKIEILCLPDEIIKMIMKLSNERDFTKIYALLHGSDVKDDDIKKIFLIFHTIEIVRHIFNWITENIRYISDPPDDWFKPAIHTLVVGSGDCDDIAILTCSLLRSIGFRTYLGFLPNHVFPGVILTRIRTISISKLNNEDKQKLKNILNLTDNYSIITSEIVEVPLERVDTVSFEMDGSKVTLELFTLALMSEKDIEILYEKISSLKSKYIDELRMLEQSMKTADLEIVPMNLNELEKIKVNIQMIEKAEESIKSFIRYKAAKIYYID